METLISQKKSDDSAEAIQALETSVKILARLIVKEVMAELRAQERFFGDAGSSLAAPISSGATGVNQPGKRLVYSVTEAMTLLGISRASAYNLIRTGQIPFLRFGTRIVIPRVALLKMLEEAGSVKPGSSLIR
ncbi:MAG: helix-turn-helix domain-containing protein [Chloroflexi bacterium]|nr:helix-turn-helix domain-containing protein [Chloroflexota bacterium]